MISLTIDGIKVEVEEGSTILNACKKAGIKVPTLCFLKEINEIGACRMCLVEVEGMRGLVTSCVYPASEGMVVHTNTKRVRESRRNTLELLLSDHDQNCLSCPRSLNCELQALAKEYDCDSNKYVGEKSKAKVDDSSPCFIRNNKKCIKCRRCVAVCSARQSVGVIGMNKRGFNSYVGCSYDNPLGNSTCVNCGQCVINCPTGALVDKSQKEQVFNELSKHDKRLVVAMAPSVRVALGEKLGSDIGENVEGKMVTALKMLGFDDVFDIDFGADLTIMEEANEFLERLKSSDRKPMFTSCCPAWIKFVEHFFPEFIPNLSTCKSPQQMMGATIKTYYANKLNVDPSSIYFVSIMPCIAKKFERLRENQNAGGVPDVDAVLTTRELGEMIKTSGFDFMNLKESEFDKPLGISAGSGVIFGATGGVMEAALRTLADTLEGKNLSSVEYLLVRGLKGTKEAEINVAGKTVKIAVVSGLKNARTLLEKIKSGEKTYDFVEVMSCPGGCANGGGQPVHPAEIINNKQIAEIRAKGLYESDVKNKYRKAHENPSIKDIYKNFFGAPGSEKAHKILHTTYVDRTKQ